MDSNKKNYNCILSLSETLTEDEILSIVNDYTKFFKKLGLKSISVAKLDLNWNPYTPVPIFLEFRFKSPAKAISLIYQKLRLDESVIRFYIEVNLNF